VITECGMGSAFPGMDPFLEDPAYWSDFHHEFIGALRVTINQKLPQPYIAKIDEHVTIVDPETNDERLVKPDVAVVRKSPTTRLSGSAAVVEVEEDLKPQTVANIVYLDPITQGYIEIRRRSDQQLVTVIEVLSPANKNGGRGQYLDRRELLLRQSVGLVELDLLRGGRRLSFSAPLPIADYFVFVSRADKRPQCDVYHWNIRRRLPVVPVPLKPGEPDLRLDVQQAMDAAFDRGEYAKMIEYDRPIPGPAFSTIDAEWTAECAREAHRKKANSE
jgi:uncharacterized protein DUF4058